MVKNNKIPTHPLLPVLQVLLELGHQFAAHHLVLIVRVRPMPGYGHRPVEAVPVTIDVHQVVGVRLRRLRVQHAPIRPVAIVEARVFWNCLLMIFHFPY